MRWLEGAAVQAVAWAAGLPMLGLLYALNWAQRRPWRRLGRFERRRRALYMAGRRDEARRLCERFERRMGWPEGSAR